MTSLTNPIEKQVNNLNLEFTAKSEVNSEGETVIKIPSRYLSKMEKSVPKQHRLTNSMFNSDIVIGGEKGVKYIVKMKPLHYFDNGGIFSWDSAAEVTPVDGGASFESSALIGSGFYVTDADGNTRKSGGDGGTGWSWLLIPVILILLIQLVYF